MSDSIFGLGNNTLIFRTIPDWVSDPEYGQEFGRNILQYNLAKSAVRILTTNTGIMATYGFTNMDKGEEYTVVQFFIHSVMGRRDNFWLPIYDSRFQPWDTTSEAGKVPAIVIGSDIFNIKQCGFRGIFREYERLFIILNDGSLFTRKILAVSDAGDYEAIQIDTTAGGLFERNLFANDIAIAGILALCRFDQDELAVEHDTAFVSSCQLTFKELAQEYGAIDE
jgi:hypothetical protein